MPTRRRLTVVVICAAVLFAMLGAIARAGRTLPWLVPAFNDHAIAVDEAFWGVSLVLIGLAFALFSSKVQPVARVWAVIGGVAVAFGVAVVVRAAFPHRVTLTVTEREAGLADGGSGSDRGYVTDERGRRWEMSMATYDRLSEGDRVVCAARSWTWSNAPDLNGELTDCKSVQASE